MRIDDRLIHGQVIASWCRHQRFTHIVIVDDAVAHDPFLRDVLTLAAPPGLVVEVFSLDEGAERLSQDYPERSTTMVLVRSPQVAYALYQRGVRFQHLNVGSVGSAPGRRTVFKNIALSDEEIALLQGLYQQGVQITLLTVPGEKAKDFSEIIGRSAFSHL